MVIASIGRPGLTQILMDIQESGLGIPLEVILVLDGVDQNHPDKDMWKKMCSKLICLPRKVGPSAAYSIGLREIDTEFFRVFTDDDKWDGRNLQEVMKSLESGTALICKTKVHDELGIDTRNSHFPSNSSPLLSVYAPVIPWRRNNVYFHLTSMIFPYEASKILFDERLAIREDLDWLQKIYESGIKFTFSDVVLSTVFPSHRRSAERTSLQIDSDWILRLMLISNELARDFFYFHCFRSFAVNGEPSKILIRLALLCKIVGKPNFNQLMSIFVYLNFSYFMKIKRILRR